jgi:prevent-host-death family protein
MRSVTSTEAKAKLNALLAEIEQTGAPVLITSRGRAVAVLSPAHPLPRRFGQLPTLSVPDSFDDPLPEDEIAAWEGRV